MKRLFKYPYPKLTLLVVFSILSYFIFSDSNVSDFVSHLGEMRYIGIFIAGILFSFGFTTPFAIGFFVIANPDNLLLAAALGGFGAFLSDIFIFKVIKTSFMDEFKKLEKTKPLKGLIDLADKDLSMRFRHYLLYVVAGIVIASPLPDELGVSMLVGLSHIKPFSFALISFIMNSLGILVMLLI